MEGETGIGQTLVAAITSGFNENLPAIVTLVGLFIVTGVVIKLVRKNAKP